MRNGALHVLEKPVRPIDLIGTIQEALAINQDRRQAAEQQRALRERIASLTGKERQVLIDRPGQVRQGHVHCAGAVRQSGRIAPPSPDPEARAGLSTGTDAILHRRA